MYDFDISKYKRFARVQLKNRWTTPILMTLVAMLVQALLSLLAAMYFFRNENLDIALSLVQSSDAWSATDALSSLLFMSAVLFRDTPLYVWLCSVASFFIAAVFTVAQIYVYLKMSRSPDNVSFGSFFEGLAYWWRAVRASIWKNFWAYLWSLLFVVPGIIKFYFSYSQLEFIVAEFPHIPVRKALDMSKKIMKGHKLDWLCLNLSFIGWFLLSAITWRIADLGITPYFTVTRVNAYHAIMKDALERGVITMDELSPQR